MSAIVTSYNGEIAHITDEIPNSITSSFNKIKTRCGRHLSNYYLGGYGPQYHCNKCGNERQFEIVRKHRKKASAEEKQRRKEEDEKHKRLFQKRKEAHRLLVKKMSYALEKFGMDVEIEYYPNSATIKCEIDDFKFKIRGLVEGGK